MSIAAKLKKKAAEFEQKKQFDKALQLYVQILDESDGDDGEADVALYNRVGDLLMRQGSVGEAMTYYEKAVDIYAESGFFNNAIALCNKILRQSPGRNSIYYKLGKISAKKGFISDAKQNFLEYASRMQGGGQLDEAFRALKEFADLCPDQDDIRLMLAEQLSKDGRKAESLEQLQLLYQRYESEGRTSEMNATLDRMRVIDPAAEPRSGGGARSMKSSELVFLDLSEDGPKTKAAGAPAGPAAAAKPRPPAPSAPAAAKTAPPKAPPPKGEKGDVAPRAGASSPPVRPPAPGEEPPTLGSSADLESAAGDRDDDLLPLAPTDDAESISGFMTNEQFAEPEFVGSRKRGLEPSTLDDELTSALNDALPDLDAPLSGRQFASLHLATPLDVPIILPPEHDLALPGDLPPLSPLRAQSISLTGEMDLIIPDADASGMQSAESTMPRAPLRPPTRTAASPAPTEGSEPGATARPQPASRPPTAPPGGATRRRASASDLPMLDVDLPEPEKPARPARPSRAGADDLMLVEGAELLDVSDPLTDSSDAADRDDVDARLDEDWTEGEEDVATPLQIIEADPATPEDIGGVGYENRIDLPDWMDELAAPKTRENGSTAPHPAIPRPSGPTRRPSRSPLGRSVDILRAQVDESPNDWSLRRALGEALLDDGDREAGLHELEATMIGFERAQDLEAARSMADEIIRLTPNSVRHHQKRVEYAFRTNDRTRLPEAYLELADALFRSGQADKARAVYHRVLELAPHDGRAQAALSTFGEGLPTTGSPSAERATPAAKPGRSTSSHLPGAADAATPSSLAGIWPTTGPAAEEPSARAARPTAPSRRSAPAESSQERARPAASDATSVNRSPNDSFVNLGDLVRDDDNPKSTRLVVEDEEPSGDEAADFADMLKRFKQGIAENVDDEDHESHYDLGVAYKEMGLVDEAISEFQKALRSPDRRARTFEALGQCFVEKQQFRVAATILGRALSEPGVTDDQLVGVLYLLGYTSEALMQWEAAISYYQRVFAVDIQFRDTAQRLSALERTPR